MISLKLTRGVADAVLPGFVICGVKHYNPMVRFIDALARGGRKGHYLRFSRSDATPIDVWSDGICMPRGAAVYFRAILVKTCAIVSDENDSRCRVAQPTQRALWRLVRELDVWLDANGLGASAIDRLAYADKGESPKRRGRKSQ